jgi:phosphate transport system permease protein
MATATIGVRERMARASKRIARVKLLDRTATGVITAGGIFIIVCVLFIFVFVFGEAAPLFRPAKAEKLGVLTSLATTAVGAGPEQPFAALGVDEHQRYLYEVTPRATVVFFRLPLGTRDKELPIVGLAGATVTSVSRSLRADKLALATSDGRVALVQVRFKPVFKEQTLADLELELREGAVVAVDPQRRPIREVSRQDAGEDGTLVAALVGDEEIRVAHVPGSSDAAAGPTPPVLETLHTRPGDTISHVRAGLGNAVVVGTRGGNLYHWETGGGDATRLTAVTPVAPAAVTALEWALGGNTLVVGDETGGVSAWFRARLQPETDLAFVKAHEFAPQGSAIVAIAPSGRERSFATGGADGSVVLRHLTSERTLLSLSGAKAGVGALVLTPRADGILIRRGDGTVDRYSLDNPHPEFSWRALVGRVWYEGYPEPSYVWQSTGASEEFESKLSLVPLIVGTIKATAYALVFAVPLAVMGALYTSQFVHPKVKAKIKPTVEIMAALPSVVIGFVAGLWLASRVEAALVPMLLMVALLPLFGTSGAFLWDRLPQRLRKRLRPGTEILVIVPLLLAGGWAALAAGPWVEGAFFGGDARQWLTNSLGLVYDQRNSLVVGIAMGFAVIPIIFTISEDAFSSVPPHLSAASLALGASRWQTATRVVLPTASPGIFSGVMVGFGRAVGETMIVLMATGNTPLLDWSPFNGMRTLSANIAVEVPEAPHGATLYRVLFLSACVLFVMTFLVNTAAELVRQHLREKYKAI